MHIRPNLSLWVHPIWIYFKTKLFCFFIEIQYFILFFKRGHALLLDTLRYSISARILPSSSLVTL